MKQVKSQKSKGKSLIILFIFYFLLLPSLANAQSALATAANALSPGQWVAFTSSNYSSGNYGRAYNFLTNQQVCYPNGPLWQDQDKAAGWYSPSPGQGSIVMNGGVHTTSMQNDCNAGTTIRYNESTNSWDRNIAQVLQIDGAFLCINGAANAACALANTGVGGTTGHIYHNDTVVTTTGDMYHTIYGSPRVVKWTRANNSWSECTQYNGGFRGQVAKALEYFPDRDSLLVVDGDWGVWEMPNISSGNCTVPWIQRASTAGGGFSPQLALTLYSQQSRYSSLCHCIVFGGGGSDVSRHSLYRYMSNGTIQSVTTAGAFPPNGIGVTGASKGSIFTVDPASGKILVWDADTAATGVHEYDPQANSAWVFVSTPTQPLFPTQPGFNFDVLAVPINAYGGFIMFVYSGDPTGLDAIYLYKHAAAVVDTTPPTVPTGVAGTPVGSSQINLAWTSSTDPESFVSGYQVDRCQGATCTTGFTQIATPTTNSYNDTKLTSQTAYRYRVRAVNGQGLISGNSATSAAITTGVADTVAPVVAVTDPPNTTPVSAGTAGSYNLVGTATDNIGVTTITLVNDRGGSYTVNTSGTSVSWNRAVNLFNGTNVITTTAQDAEGNNSTAVVRTITTTIVGPSLTPTPTATSPGATVNVAFTGVASPTTRDWIGLYPIGAPDAFNPAYPWFYTVGSPTCTQTSVPFSASVPPAVASGSCNFTMPATAGTYNFRMFSNDAETNPLAVTATVTSTAVVDTTAPSTPTGLNAIAINNTINLSWIASSDNIGVTGYRVERCSGTNCGSTPANFVQVYTPSVNTQIDSGLAATTPYSYRVRATDAAGNLSGYSAIASATTGTIAPGGGSDFTTRCSQPGVVRCFGFEAGELNLGLGGTNGAWGQNNGYMPPFGTSNYTNISLDTSDKTSGASSLRFRVPGAGGDSGSWFSNFSTDLLTQIQPGEQIYIQIRFKVDSNFYNQTYPGSRGFKIMDISGGDRPECPNNVQTRYCPGSCWTGENVFTTDLRGTPTKHLPVMYSNCSGGGPTFAGWYSMTSNIVFQTSTGCLYPNAAEPPCVYLTPNVWWTAKVYLRVGTYNTYSSTGTLWMGPDGSPLTKITECGPAPLTNCSAGAGNANGLFIAKDTIDDTGSNTSIVLGKVWLLPYQTGASWTGLQDGYVWYDELIVSRNDIADPGPGTTPGPGITITQPPNNGTIQVNTATITLGGTIQ